MRLTRQSIAALSIPPGKSELIVFDDALSGFGIRLRGGGKRVWIVQYRFGTKQRRVTLGRVEAVDPDEARKQAKTLLAKTQLGGDPQAEKAEAKLRAAVTLGTAVQRYLLHYATPRLKHRSLLEVRRHLSDHWRPLHGLPLTSVKRADVAARLTELATANGPIAANRARAALSGLFAWAMREGLAEANPVVGTNLAAPERSRDRVLSDVELAAIWLACRDDDHGRIVRLLMLTGQRREEVGGMRWEELDTAKKLWTIPAERTKNRRPHEVPLPEPALALLRDQIRRGERDFVFGEAAGPFQGWSRAKNALDKRIGAAKAKVGAWRLHDLRRTAATRMAELGVQPHVIEAILNHVSGHKAGVAGVYNRALYAAEKRDALDRWATHVSGLLAHMRSQAGASPK